MYFELPKPSKIQQRDLNYGRILEIVRNGAVEAKYLGNGSDSIVVTFPDKAGIVVAYTFDNNFNSRHAGFWTPEKAKRMFYINKILATLFPHNFPNLRFVVGKPEWNLMRRLFDRFKYRKQPVLFGSIREKVEGVGGVRIGSKNPFQHVLDSLLEIGIDRPEVFFDDKSHVKDFKHANIISTANGNEYYVDVIDKSRFGDPRRFDAELINFGQSILGYMKRKNYDEYSIAHVSKMIQRLKLLASHNS